MSALFKDFSYGVRTLRQSLTFTTVAILSLALGIGANTAIFQLLDALRLRLLPVAEPRRLALVQFADPAGQRGSQETTYPALTNPQWERFRDTQDAFSGVLAWWPNNFAMTADDEVRPTRGIFVNGDFFRVLGVPALRGRVFTSADDRRGCGLPGAVISYTFWQREFGGEPSAIGSRLTLNYQRVEVIGVTPPGFSGLEIGRAFDIAVPICSQASLWTEGHWLDAGTSWWLTVMGRLKPGQTIERANAQLAGLSPGLFQSTLPANYPHVSIPVYLKLRLTAVPAATGVSQLRREYTDPLILLLLTGGLVLLIACANLANLMLARAAAREHEIAVRMAMGASRGRLVRQLTAESLLLSAAGVAIGLYLSGALGRFLIALLATRGDPLFLDLSPDPAALAFATALGMLTCLLFGLAPAWRGTRVTPVDAMRAKGRGVAGRREGFGLRQALVVSQVALSLALVVGALLFSGSFRKLLSLDAGFRQNGILVADVDFRRLPIPPAGRIAFKQELRSRLRAVPGVEGAGEVDILPLSGGHTSNAVWPDSSETVAKLDAAFNRISEGYLKTMGMQLLAGRDFDARDTLSSPRVAIVNQSFARRLGLGDNPIGKRFRREATPSEPEIAVEIVGLVRDSKYLKLSESFLPIAFLSTGQDLRPASEAQLLIRSSAPLTALIAQTRAAVAAVSPDITTEFASFAAIIAEGLIRERLMAILSGFFGGLAALIAALGLYGVMSYLVARRTNEIGIRIALGAERRHILSLVLHQSATMLAIGLACGAAISLAAARAIRSLLFDLEPHDAGTLISAVALLAGVTIVASYLPARRAARLDPMAALRED